jgi:hypothetical protein
MRSREATVHAKARSRNPSAWASETTKAPAGSARPAFSLATESISNEKSAATTVLPDRASGMVSLPVPAPASRIGPSCPSRRAR